jgi:hypothetical protein
MLDFNIYYIFKLLSAYYKISLRKERIFRLSNVMLTKICIPFLKIMFREKRNFVFYLECPLNYTTRGVTMTFPE